MIAAPIAFSGDELIVTRSVYIGTAATVPANAPLPGCTITTSQNYLPVANGTYPNVFRNEAIDPSFGVTSPIFIDQLTLNGAVIRSTNLTALAAAQNINLSTSFPSKSELTINRSTNGQALTLMGYVAPVNALDVSNSNVLGHVDPTNPVALTYQRAVAQINLDGTLLVTPVNVYSGNNGRAAVLDNGINQYLMVGNAGNGSGPSR